MSRVLIVGCGYLGTALGQALARRGQEVWGLRRDPRALPGEIKGIPGDLCQADSLGRLPPDLDWIILAIAANGTRDEEYRRVFVDGTRNLLDATALPQGAPRRMIMISTTGVYGHMNGEWIDTTTAVSPGHFKTRRILEGERMLVEHAPCPVTILRLAGLYGPGRTRLIRAVREGPATFVPGAPQYLNQIHRDDAAGVIVHLMDLPEPAPLYIGVDHEPAPRREVLQWLAEQLDAPPPRAVQPGEPPPGRPRGNKRCSNAELVRSGYGFRYPTYREGYGALIRSTPDAT